MIISDLVSSYNGPGTGLANPQALANPAVGCISFRQKWGGSSNGVQPTAPAGGVPTNNPNDGSYSWTFFDSAVAQAASYGKKAWLRVIPQASSGPTWLNSAVYVDTVGDNIFLWWDTNFQNYVIAMIQAMAARYASNSTVIAFTCNIAADHTGDWTMPNVKASTSPTGAANWQIQSSFTCPAYGSSVTVTPIANQLVHNLWAVFITNFGWFQITGFTGPGTNPTSVTLKNLGISGNASSGTVPATSIMFVSDIANLQGPVYNYTTARFLTALEAVVAAAQTAWSNQVIVNEVGRSGTLDPWY